MQKKKLLALLLAVLAIVGVMPLGIFAGDGEGATTDGRYQPRSTKEDMEIAGAIVMAWSALETASVNSAGTGINNTGYIDSDAYNGILTAGNITNGMFSLANGVITAETDFSGGFFEYRSKGYDANSKDAQTEIQYNATGSYSKNDYVIEIDIKPGDDAGKVGLFNVFSRMNLISKSEIPVQMNNEGLYANLEPLDGAKKGDKIASIDPTKFYTIALYLDVSAKQWKVYVDGVLKSTMKTNLVGACAGDFESSEGTITIGSDETFISGTRIGGVKAGTQIRNIGVYYSDETFGYIGEIKGDAVVDQLEAQTGLPVMVYADFADDYLYTGLGITANKPTITDGAAKTAGEKMTITFPTEGDITNYNDNQHKFMLELSITIRDMSTVNAATNTGIPIVYSKNNSGWGILSIAKNGKLATREQTTGNGMVVEATPAVGTTYNVAIFYDPTTSVAKIYLNGEFVTNDSALKGIKKAFQNDVVGGDFAMTILNVDNFDKVNLESFKLYYVNEDLYEEDIPDARKELFDTVGKDNVLCDVNYDDMKSIPGWNVQHPYVAGAATFLYNYQPDGKDYLKLVEDNGNKYISFTHGDPGSTGQQYIDFRYEGQSDPNKTVVTTALASRKMQPYVIKFGVKAGDTLGFEGQKGFLSVRLADGTSNSNGYAKELMLIDDQYNIMPNTYTNSTAKKYQLSKTEFTTVGLLVVPTENKVYIYINDVCYTPDGVALGLDPENQDYIGGAFFRTYAQNCGTAETDGTAISFDNFQVFYTTTTNRYYGAKNAETNAALKVENKMALALYSDISAGFRVKASVLNGLVNPVIDIVYGDGLTASIAGELDEAGEYYIFKTIRFSPDTIGKDIKVKLCAYNANGDIVYGTETVTANIATYCYKLYESDNETYKNLAIAVLNYAAAAQKYVDNTVTDLVNADLAAGEKEVPEFTDSDYAYGFLDAVDPDDVEFTGISMSLNNGYRFDLSRNIGDTESFRFVDYDDDSIVYGAHRSPSTEDGWKTCFFYFSEANAADLRTSVVAQLISTDPDTEEVSVLAEIEMSLDIYATMVAEDTTAPEELVALTEAMIAYADAAAAFQAATSAQ